jgi:hypothetical protein
MGALARAVVVVVVVHFLGQAQRGEGGDHVIKMLQNQAQILANLGAEYNSSIERSLRAHNGDDAER